ncbi:MAG: hypothetical protein AAF799_19325 [Myxococcota bacterium]
MAPLQLRPWYETTSRDVGLGGSDDVRDELRAMLDDPHDAARLRASVESELGSGADLSDPGLLEGAGALLDRGRHVAGRGPTRSIAVNPRHPIGDGMEDLGNLVDLLRDEPANDDHEDPTPMVEVLRPTWIEIAVVDASGQPITNRPYRLRLPDGSVREGELGDDGLIRFDDVEPGLCTLELPTRQPEEWAPSPRPLSA